VVDELAAAHRGRQRLGIEHVSADRLGAELTERAGRVLRASERVDAVALPD
jgi:hypothetical protein